MVFFNHCYVKFTQRIAYLVRSISYFLPVPEGYQYATRELSEKFKEGNIIGYKIERIVDVITCLNIPEILGSSVLLLAILHSNFLWGRRLIKNKWGVFLCVFFFIFFIFDWH